MCFSLLNVRPGQKQSYIHTYIRDSQIIQHLRENVNNSVKYIYWQKKLVLICLFNFTHKNIKILYRDFYLNIVKFVLINSLKHIHCTMTTCLSFLIFSAHLISFLFFQGTMHLKLCIVTTWYLAIYLRDLTAFHAIHIPIGNSLSIKPHSEPGA